MKKFFHEASDEEREHAQKLMKVFVINTYFTCSNVWNSTFRVEIIITFVENKTSNILSVLI